MSDKMSCGHEYRYISRSDERTNFCVWCEWQATVAALAQAQAERDASNQMIDELAAQLAELQERADPYPQEELIERDIRRAASARKVAGVAQTATRRAEQAEAVEARMRKLLVDAVAMLPDSRNGSDWEYCWNELTEESQESVKEMRRTLAAALAGPEGGPR